jgi:hypothetical protein
MKNNHLEWNGLWQKSCAVSGRESFWIWVCTLVQWIVCVVDSWNSACDGFCGSLCKCIVSLEVG